ncbi:MAG TPA: DUF1345 domain-containing protein [Stenomitos sp.]
MIVKRLKALEVHSRLILGILVGVIVFLGTPTYVRFSTRLLLTWNAGVLAFLGLTSILVLRTTALQLKQRYHSRKQSNTVIFTLIVAAASVSLLAIGLLLSNATSFSRVALVQHFGLSMLAILESWLLLHTTFAFRYADLYYRSLAEDKPGLAFPNPELPDYVDFLYFSFGVGMTSQVADIAVTSPYIRRFVLLHSVVAFIFNTSIVALSINIIAGLISPGQK